MQWPAGCIHGDPEGGAVNHMAGAFCWGASCPQVAEQRVCLGLFHERAFQVAPVVKNLPTSAGRCKRPGFNPWVRKIPWRRAWQPHQYFCLKNPVDRGAWQATVHRVTKRWTQLKWLSMHSPEGKTVSLSMKEWLVNSKMACKCNTNFVNFLW